MPRTKSSDVCCASEQAKIGFAYMQPTATTTSSAGTKNKCSCRSPLYISSLVPIALAQLLVCGCLPFSSYDCLENRWLCKTTVDANTVWVGEPVITEVLSGWPDAPGMMQMMGIRGAGTRIGTPVSTSKTSCIMTGRLSQQ